PLRERSIIKPPTVLEIDRIFESPMHSHEVPFLHSSECLFQFRSESVHFVSLLRRPLKLKTATFNAYRFHKSSEVYFSPSFAAADSNTVICISRTPSEELEYAETTCDHSGDISKWEVSC